MNSLKTLMEITEIKLNKEVPYNDCDVAAIVQDITAQLHSTIFEKHAVITLDIQVSCVKYPKAYLESILYNFISNALKYSHADIPPEIKVTTRLFNNRVQIIVKDNGIGIDMERYGDRVFKLNEVFHQGYDSKGVGLYITKTQVESFGGSIEVHSAPNKGSEFIVTL
jgi:signal transduction histidine kinase